MEYLILKEHPHIASRHAKLQEARQVDGQWCALFRTKHYYRMKLHVEKLRESVAILIGKAMNLTDVDEMFTVIHSVSFGYIALARGKKDVK